MIDIEFESDQTKLEFNQFVEWFLLLLLVSTRGSRFSDYHQPKSRFPAPNNFNSKSKFDCFKRNWIFRNWIWKQLKIITNKLKNWKIWQVEFEFNCKLNWNKFFVSLRNQPEISKRFDHSKRNWISKNWKWLLPINQTRKFEFNCKNWIEKKIGIDIDIEMTWLFP